MKRILFGILLIIVCSCEKESIIDQHIIERPYYLCEYLWDGPCDIDINNNGNNTSDLFRVFALWGDENIHKLYFSPDSSAPSGSCTATFPAVLGDDSPSLSYGEIGFDYSLSKDQILIGDAAILLSLPEGKSAEIYDISITFYDDSIKDLTLSLFPHFSENRGLT